MNVSSENMVEKAVQLLWQAEQTGVPCPPVRELIGVEDLDLAYQVQRQISQKKIGKGAIPVGKKIGLTSLAVQKQLGVDQPDYGELFSNMEVVNGGKLSPEELMQGRVEAEFALILNNDLDTKLDSTDELIEAIEEVRISLEIVGSRIENWNIRITDTIADNASASHFVLGNESFDPKKVDFIKTKARIFKGDVLSSEGIGEACMGSPLIAGQWLANTMIGLGNPLRKGEILLTGALGPMVGIGKGDEVKAVFEGMGEVGFQLA